MKIVMISGSRNTQGQTARAASAILDGAENAGCVVEQIFLPALDIERCIQCEDSGWGICRKEGICILEDDFASIVDKVRQADAVVFATPSYYGDLSESMRAFLDRLRRICATAEGRINIQDKPAMGLCVAGGGGGGSLSCCVSLEKVLNGCGFDVLDMIPVKRQNLKAKLNNLRLNGAWLATAAKLKPAS
ncbi:MAG: flavodoxin family protein [Chloroflexi bacterium]|nr:flavodoxin family protein [Chloroflexota bacterium]